MAESHGGRPGRAQTVSGVLAAHLSTYSSVPSRSAWAAATLYTFLMAEGRGLAPNAVASDKTVAIRLVGHEFCKQLIREFGKPIVSTSANISGSAPPTCFDDIEKELLSKADYIVNLSRKEIQKSASQIVKFDKDGQIIYIRK